MRIEECYIRGFGKISGKRLVFGNGLNSTLADNGSGKSTLSAFICAMLYGLPDTKRAQLDENDRKKYLPWDGGAFGGSLTVEAGDRLYRIERYFGKKASDDTFLLYDAKTGHGCSDFGENIGEELFGIDRDGFLRTALLSEKILSEKNANKSISAKLSGLSDAKTDMSELDNALAVLDERRKFYFKRGGAGVIADSSSAVIETERGIAELKRKEAAVRKSEDELKLLRERLVEKKREYTELLTKRAENGGKTRPEEWQREREKLKNELERQKQRYKELARFFKSGVPDYSEIDRYSSQVSVPQRKKSTHFEERGRGKHRARYSLSSLVSLLIGAALCALGFGMGEALRLPLLFAGAVFVLIFIIFAIAAFAQKNEASRSARSETDSKRLEEQTAARFLARFPTETCSPLDEIRDRLTEYRALEFSISVRERELEQLGGLSDKGSDGNEPRPIGALEKRLEALDGEISELARRVAVTERMIEADVLELSRLDMLEARLAELRRQTQQHEDNLAVIQKAMQYLTMAHEAMTKRYLGKMKGCLDAYCEAVGLDGGEFALDTELVLTRYDAGVARRTESYSRGTRELYSIIVRLALTDALFEGEKPFIILDDPFAALDDKTLETVKRAIKQLSRSRQIIYLTCSSSRMI